MLHFIFLFGSFELRSKRSDFVAVSNNKKRVMISLTVTQKNDLDKLSEETGISKSSIVAIALEDYKKNKKKGQK